MITANTLKQFITEVLLTESNDRGSGFGIKKLDLIVYVISELNDANIPVTQPKVLERVAELEGKPYKPGSNKEYFKTLGDLDRYAYRANLVRHQIENIESSQLNVQDFYPDLDLERLYKQRFLLNQKGKELAAQVKAKLDNSASQYAADAVDLDPYYETSNYLVTTEPTKMYFASTQQDDKFTHEVYRTRLEGNDYNSKIYIDMSAKIAVPTGSILKLLVVDYVTIVRIVNQEDILFLGKNPRSFTIPMEVPAEVLEQAKKRSVYLDTQLEAGKKVSTKEIKRLEVLTQYGKAV
jgi:hypothetical protein